MPGRISFGLSFVQDIADAIAGITARGQYRGQIGVFRATELVAPVDDVDVVLTRERERVFDGRVAGADDDDRLVAKCLGVVEVVFDAVEILAFHAETARVAFEPNREHDELGRISPPPANDTTKSPCWPLIDVTSAAVADVDRRPGEVIGPPLQDRLPAAFGEIEIAAQIEIAGLGHHEFAFLIALDRLGRGAIALEQHVARRAAARSRGRSARRDRPHSVRTDLDPMIAM